MYKPHRYVDAGLVGSIITKSNNPYELDRRNTIISNMHEFQKQLFSWSIPTTPYKYKEAREFMLRPNHDWFDGTNHMHAFKLPRAYADAICDFELLNVTDIQKIEILSNEWIIHRVNRSVINLINAGITTLSKVLSCNNKYPFFKHDMFQEMELRVYTKTRQTMQLKLICIEFDRDTESKNIINPSKLYSECRTVDEKLDVLANKMNEIIKHCPNGYFKIQPIDIPKYITMHEEDAYNSPIQTYDCHEFDAVITFNEIFRSNNPFCLGFFIYVENLNDIFNYTSLITVKIDGRELNFNPNAIQSRRIGSIRYIDVWDFLSINYLYNGFIDPVESVSASPLDLFDISNWHAIAKRFVFMHGGRVDQIEISFQSSTPIHTHVIFNNLNLVINSRGVMGIKYGF